MAFHGARGFAESCPSEIKLVRHLVGSPATSRTIAEELWELSDKSSEKSEMSALAEASMLVRELAEPGSPGETVKAALQRACRRLGGWPPSRVRDLWYADPRISVSADEMNRLRAAARREREEEQEARDETPIHQGHPRQDRSPSAGGHERGSRDGCSRSATGWPSVSPPGSMRTRHDDR